MFQRFLYAAPATILFVAVFVAPVRAITPDKAEFKKLADGVYAYVGKLNDANAMVVVTSQGVVVIDTGNNQPETRNILKYIQGVTQQPVRYVVITQNHGDHIGGTPLFSPPATVVLHARTAKEWAGWKSYQVNTWRKRFPDRAEALKNLHPLDAALTFTKERTQFGKKLVEFQGLSFMLADMATQIEAARALTLEAARRRDAGDSYSTQAAMAKLFASDTAMRVTTDAVQAHGGYGYVNEFPVERYMREAKVLQIIEGTNQIQRLVIGRNIARQE